jgi:hypothetical protein
MKLFKTVWISMALAVSFVCDAQTVESIAVKAAQSEPFDYLVG